jgi:hypothetical protein
LILPRSKTPVTRNVAQGDEFDPRFTVGRTLTSPVRRTQPCYNKGTGHLPLRRPLHPVFCFLISSVSQTHAIRWCASSVSVSLFLILRFVVRRTTSLSLFCENCIRLLLLHITVLSHLVSQTYTTYNSIPTSSPNICETCLLGIFQRLCKYMDRREHLFLPLQLVCWALVTVWVLEKILLVIILCIIPLACRGDFCHDLQSALVNVVLLNLCCHALRRFFLFRTVVEDCGTIL